MNSSQGHRDSRASGPAPWAASWRASTSMATASLQEGHSGRAVVLNDIPSRGHAFYSAWQAAVLSAVRRRVARRRVGTHGSALFTDLSP